LDACDFCYDWGVLVADMANAPPSGAYDNCSSGLSLSSKLSDGGIGVRKSENKGLSAIL